MSSTRLKLIKQLSKRFPLDGFHPLSVPLTDFIRFSESKPRGRTYWHSSFVVILQGRKEITLEDYAYKYREAHVIITPVGLPVIGRVVVEKPNEPFLALRIKIDPLILNEIAAKLPLEVVPKGLSTHGILTGPTDDKILSTVLRLTEVTEDDAAVLGPLIIRELYYHFLKSNHGHTIRQFVLAGSKFQSITEAINKIRNDLPAELDVESFAREAHMSRTAFFSTFKEVTAMSPIQYQKKLRLLEARHLLQEKGETAESAAFEVGYKSASQFSRDFSRLFGHPPGQSKLRARN